MKNSLGIESLLRHYAPRNDMGNILSWIFLSVIVTRRYMQILYDRHCEACKAGRGNLIRYVGK